MISLSNLLENSTFISGRTQEMILFDLLIGLMASIVDINLLVRHYNSIATYFATLVYRDYLHPCISWEILAQKRNYTTHKGTRPDPRFYLLNSRERPLYLEFLVPKGPGHEPELAGFIYRP